MTNSIVDNNEAGKPFAHDVQLEHMDDLKVAEGWNQVREDAIAAEEAEHQISLREAFRLYPTAIFWSFAMSLVIIMEVSPMNTRFTSCSYI